MHYIERRSDHIITSTDCQIFFVALDRLSVGGRSASCARFFSSSLRALALNHFGWDCGAQAPQLSRPGKPEPPPAPTPEPQDAEARRASNQPTKPSETEAREENGGRRRRDRAADQKQTKPAREAGAHTRSEREADARHSASAGIRSGI